MDLRIAITDDLNSEREKLSSAIIAPFSKVGLNVGNIDEYTSGEELLRQFSAGRYDLIFLDGPKAQYLKYLPDLKRLLKIGGVLFSDDVLLYGWVNGEAPKKRHVLVEKIREYLRVLCDDESFWTSVLELGDGVAVSVRVS